MRDAINMMESKMTPESVARSRKMARQEIHRVATDEEFDAASAYVISKYKKAFEMLAEYDRS